MSIRSNTAAVLIAALLAGPALATQGFTPANNEAGGNFHAMPAAKSRDQVKQELVQARRAGSLQQSQGEVTFAPEIEDARNMRSRAEVKHEAEHARDDQELRQLYIN